MPVPISRKFLGLQRLEDLDHGLLDLSFRYVERAHYGPFRGVLAKIGGRLLEPLAADQGKAVEVGVGRRVGIGDQ